MSNPTREVLFRFTGEVDPSIKKSLNEISQLAAKTEAMKRREITSTSRTQGQVAKEQDRTAKEMRRAELAQFKAEQANIKQQQRDALKWEREKVQAQKAAQRESAREIQNSIREANKRDKYLADSYKRQEREKSAAIKDQAKNERAQEQAARRTVTANKQMDKALIGVLGSVMSLARGFALLGLAGEESSEKMLRGLLRVEGGFEMLRGGFNLVGGIGKMGRAMRGAGGSGLGSAAGGAAGGVGSRFLAGSMAAKGGLGVVAGIAATVAGKITYETIRDASKYGIGGGYRPGSWGGAVADVQAGALTKMAGLAPNSRLWQGAMNLGYGTVGLGGGVNDAFNAAREAEQTRLMQRQRMSAMTAARMQAGQASASMQLSGIQAGVAGSMLGARGGAMPLGQLFGVNPAYRKFAELGYQAPQDVQQMLIARRDYLQSSAQLPSIRDAAGRTGATDEDKARYIQALTEIQAKAQAFSDSGFKVAGTLREMEVALNEFAVQGKKALFDLALKSPVQQALVENSLQRVERGIASRRDLRRVKGLLTPEEEGRYSDMFLGSPSARSRIQNQYAKSKSTYDESLRSSVVNLNLDNQVKVTLNADYDQFRAMLDRVLEPMIIQFKNASSEIIREKFREANERTAEEIKADMSYGMR
jgi:hypothetical protein